VFGLGTVEAETVSRIGFETAGTDRRDSVAMIPVREESGLGKKVARPRGVQSHEMIIDRASHEPNPPPPHLEDRRCSVALLEQRLAFGQLANGHLPPDALRQLIEQHDARPPAVRTTLPRPKVPTMAHKI
jgi:hypothetical protein